MPKVKGWWIVGKRNGEPIVGFRLTFYLDLGQLRVKRYWLPLARWNFGEPYFLWLCFRLRLAAQYGWL